MALSRDAFRILRCLLITIMLSAAAASPGAASKDVPTRDQIPEAYRWNLEAIYPSSAEWEEDYALCEEMIDELARRKGTLDKSAEHLYETLELSFKTSLLADRLAVYAHQRSHEDTGDSAALGPASRATSLGVAYNGATSWIEPELQALPEKKLRSWLEKHEGLAVYGHYLDDVLRKKEHTLSAQEEELLALTGNLAAAPSATYNVLANAELPYPTIRDEAGEEVVLSSSRFRKYIQSADRRVRRDAFLGCMEAYRGFENTMAGTLAGAVQRDLFFARARGFDSCLEASLFPDRLPVSIHENLVATVRAHLPVLHRWASLRKRVLALDELHVWDLYQPLVADVSREVPYEEAVEMIVAALEPLGAEYGDAMREGFRSRWIDVYETRGKRGGAYSWGSYDTTPYILLNYQGTLNDVFTVAHEMGHSMHSYFTHANQPPVYGDYSYFVAEVASTFNEILLLEHLLESTEDPRERLGLLNHAIDEIRGTVLRQTMFSEFELGIHEMAERGEALTADAMGELYVDTFHDYWGPELVRDAEHLPYWARIPHFYRNFYVYRYATSYCAASALAEGVLAGKPGALTAYLDFLKAGRSDYPLEILRRAGVDMTTPAPIEATLKRFEKLVGELERLL
jgi:oligoendopeptidase F